MSQYARPLVREVLTANRTYYVRTDGSDSNDGSANDAAHAFLTIQKAIDSVCDLIDTANNDVTIQVAAGTYAVGNTLRDYVGRGSITIQGDTTTPSNVVVSTTSGSCFLAGLQNSKSWTVQGFKLSTSSSGFSCLSAQAGTIQFANIEFSTSVTYHISSIESGAIVATGNYSITGGTLAHAGADLTGIVALDGRTVTITGTPAFSSAFAVGYRCGVISATSMTFSGSATGKRYDAQQNGVINTGGGGANYFPGNSAGTTSIGGQYV